MNDDIKLLSLQPEMGNIDGYVKGLHMGHT